VTRVSVKTLSTDPRPDGSVFTVDALRDIAIQMIGRPIDLDGKVHVVTRARVALRPDAGADLIVEAEA